MTISIAPGLSVREHRQAVRAGPPAVRTRGDHGTMLLSAGFAVVEEKDVTPDYLTVVRAWLREASARADALRAVHGDRVFEERQRDRRLHVAAVERGLLRRSLFVAYGQPTRPPGLESPDDVGRMP